jgi:hypothetical protein
MTIECGQEGARNADGMRKREPIVRNSSGRSSARQMPEVSAPGPQDHDVGEVAGINQENEHVDWGHSGTERRLQQKKRGERRGEGAVARTQRRSESAEL